MSRAYYLLQRVAGAGCRYQEDDETGQQEPAAAAAAGGQSQGGGKRAHRPRGANQPPKPTTDGASTSFPVACPPLPPSRPPRRTFAPSMPQGEAPYVAFVVRSSTCVRIFLPGGVIKVITTASPLRSHERTLAYRSMAKLDNYTAQRAPQEDTDRFGHRSKPLRLVH